MSRNLLALVVVFGSVAFAADLSEKWQKRLDSADAAYQAAKAKADNARFYAMQKANSDRLKVLKTALTDATKTGDFDAATAIKERMTAAEKVGTVRAKPKQTVKFGGHEYAIIEEKATWHIAKQICEEMGGHLATINTPEENTQLLAICKERAADVWIGGTDEVTEGKWEWVDGTPIPVSIKFESDSVNRDEHWLFYYPLTGHWEDRPSGARTQFVCEWDN